MHAGFGRADITVYEAGMGMLGWGRPDNVARGVDEPLTVRAMAAGDGGRTVVYACADLCFVSAALRAAVLSELARRRLSLWPCDVMLTATHTHSGPSGFSHAFFYDLSGPGYSPVVFDGLARGIADAIEQAVRRLAPARLRLGEATIPASEGIAFNRSLEAFRRNPEARRPELAVDRAVTVIRADDRSGRPIGALSLYPLHATSVHGDRQALHPDHKGLAAARFEAWARDRGADEGFVGIFAQGAAGDVTPNHRMDRRRGVRVGRFDDDLDSARFVADVQVRATRIAFDRLADDGLPLEGPVAGAIDRADYERRPVPAELAAGRATTTTTARLGLAMAEGTAEGAGPLMPLRPLVRLAHRLARGRGDPKLTLLEVGPRRQRRLLGRIDPTRLALDHPALRHARRAGDLTSPAWIPTVLPVQLLRIGPLVLAGLPNEPTTIAGRRLRLRLSRALSPAGVTRVHVQGYANAYAGYLTTPEEYTAQRYEGAYTLFGPHTFGAFADRLDALADALDPESAHDVGPPLSVLEPEALAARRFRG